MYLGLKSIFNNDLINFEQEKQNDWATFSRI